MTKKTLTALAVEKFPPAPPGKRVEHFDALLPGFGLRVTDSGKKSWVLMTRFEGKQARLTVGSYPALDLQNARKTAREWLQQLARGQDPRAEKRAAKQAAFAAPAPEVDTLRKAVAAFERLHISKLRPRSQFEARRPLDRLVERWGDRALSDIRKHEIREHLADMVEAGHPVAANRALAAVRSFFNWCVNNDRLESSPAQGIKPPGGDETSRDRVLSDAEIKVLWEAFGQAAYPFGMLCRLLLVTGQRREECAALTWAEIDFDTRLWTIPATRTKGARLHEVPLSPLALEILESIPRIGEYVFTTTGDTRVSGFSKAKIHIDTLTTKVTAGNGKPPLAAWRMHDLRRTCASGMAQAGMPPHVLSRILNHSPGKDEGVTAIYNRHGYQTEKRAALDTWARKLESLISPTEKNVVLLRG